MAAAMADAAKGDATLPGDFAGEDTYAGMEGTYMPEGFEHLDSHIRNATVHPRMTDEERFEKKVAARRQFELERRQRIFDAKRRTIGVDKDALDKQVLENQMRKEQERAMARQDNGLMLMCDKQLKLVEIEKGRKQREMEKHCKDYSLQHLHFAARSEYDLNDPLYVRKGIPARVGDDDARCGPSSMQQFNGEDLLKEERIRQQRAAMVNFVEQQKFEKAMLSANKNAEMDAFAREVAEITALRNEMEESEGNLRRELQRSQQNDNLSKAADNYQRKMDDKEYENYRNQQELNFHATDKFLNETGQVFTRDGRVDPRTSYKGTTQEEKVQAMHAQLDQCHENSIKKVQQRHDELSHAAEAEAVRKHLVATEREKQKQRRLTAMQIANENRRMHVEHAKNTKEANSLYTNAFSPEFFEQFGKGVR